MSRHSEQNYNNYCSLDVSNTFPRHNCERALKPSQVTRNLLWNLSFHFYKQTQSTNYYWYALVNCYKWLNLQVTFLSCVILFCYKNEARIFHSRFVKTSRSTIRNLVGPRNFTPRNKFAFRRSWQWECHC